MSNRTLFLLGASMALMFLAIVIFCLRESVEFSQVLLRGNNDECEQSAEYEDGKEPEYDGMKHTVTRIIFE